MAASVQVRESQVEDVLATFPHIAQDVLELEDTPRLVARQMSLPSGRLDLLYATGQTLTLVELKVEDGRPQFVDQVLHYREDLEGLQEEGKLVPVPITPTLLCPAFRDSALRACSDLGVIAKTYSPDHVLTQFFRSLKPLASLIELRPTDLGLWNIHLIHRALYTLDAPRSVDSIADRVGLSKKSVANHLRLASHLMLVERNDQTFALTELGAEYVNARNADAPPSHLSEEQAAVLRGFIVKDPFASPVIFGIYTMVEVIFDLARNGYPVPYDLVLSHFRAATGKVFDWSEDKTAYHGTHMYSNYAAELGLLGRGGDALFLTPDGLRFILLLQLHKSLRMIDVVGLSQQQQGG